jgi:hypothetical protein
MRLLICLALLIGCAAPADAEAPAKPYTPLPAPMSYAPIDPSLEALRGQLREIIKRKDVGALRAHVIAKGFFWDNDWYRNFDAKKSGFDNFIGAYGFHPGLAGGWDVLGRAVTETVATQHAKRPGLVCLPARPPTSRAEIDKFAKSIGVSHLDTVYPRSAGLPVREKPNADARVVDTLGAHFVRKLDWVTKRGQEWTMESVWMEIVTPTGKRAFAAPGTLDAVFHTQTCFGKDAAGAWKIVGTAAY